MTPEEKENRDIVGCAVVGVVLALGVIYCGYRIVNEIIKLL